MHLNTQYHTSLYVWCWQAKASNVYSATGKESKTFQFALNEVLAKNIEDLSTN